MTRQLTVELVNVVPGRERWYSTELELPAAAYEIQDARQRLRAVGQADRRLQVSVLRCGVFPALAEVQLDAPTLAELNFFAKRLAVLRAEEQIALQAVLAEVVSEGTVGMKDLINATYGLDEITVVPSVSRDEQLGAFVIDNDVHEDVASVPKNALYLLDKRLIGKLQREIDGGVFINGCYVVVGDHELPEVYDGRVLPQADPTDCYVFSLRLSEHEADDPHDEQEWVDLPRDLRALHRGRDITSFHCHALVSAIPQLQHLELTDMQEVFTLNALARRITELSPGEQLTFKAALTREQPQNVMDAMDIATHLDAYELAHYTGSAAEHFKEYVRHYMSTTFDSTWLDTLSTQKEGEHLLRLLGAVVTPYGILSARGRSLYEQVLCEQRERLRGDGVPDPLSHDPGEYMEDDSSLEACREEENVQHGGMQL